MSDDRQLDLVKLTKELHQFQLTQRRRRQVNESIVYKRTKIFSSVFSGILPDHGNEKPFQGNLYILYLSLCNPNFIPTPFLSVYVHGASRLWTLCKIRSKSAPGSSNPRSVYVLADLDEIRLIPDTRNTTHFGELRLDSRRSIHFLLLGPDSAPDKVLANIKKLNNVHPVLPSARILDLIKSYNVQGANGKRVRGYSNQASQVAKALNAIWSGSFPHLLLSGELAATIGQRALGRDGLPLSTIGSIATGKQIFKLFIFFAICFIVFFVFMTSTRVAFKDRPCRYEGFEFMSTKVLCHRYRRYRC